MLPQIIVAKQNPSDPPYNVGGRPSVFLEQVCPTTTTPYAAGDMVGGLMKFDGMPQGGAGLLMSVQCVDAAFQNIAGNLWLFRSPITVPADNAAWSITPADMKECIAVVPVSSWYTGTASGIGLVTNIGKLIRCRKGETAIYGAYVTGGAPTYAVFGLTFTMEVMPD